MTENLATQCFLLISVWLWNLKMVGPKKQDYWPKINILEGGKNKIVLKNVSSSKNGHDFSNKVAQ